MKPKYKIWDYVTCGPLVVGYIIDMMLLNQSVYWYRIGTMWVKEDEIIAKIGNVGLWKQYYE